MLPHHLCHAVGMTIALVSEVALAAPWGLDHELNYLKIGVKLLVLVAIAALLGIAGALQRQGKSLRPALVNADAER